MWVEEIQAHTHTNQDYLLILTAGAATWGHRHVKASKISSLDW